MLAAIEAMDVAAQPGEVALALGLTSNPIPAFSKLNVYIGHDFQTERYDEKAREAAAFFGTWDEARRLVFVERIGAAFIFLGPEERRWAPDFELPGWERIYDRSGYVVLRRPRD
jgi:hypothetical protein